MSAPGIAGQIQFQALFGAHSQGILGARLCGALGSLAGYYATASVWGTGVIASCSRWHQAGKTKFPGKVGEAGLRIWAGQRGESGREWLARVREKEWEATSGLRRVGPSEPHTLFCL